MKRLLVLMLATACLTGCNLLSGLYQPPANTETARLVPFQSEDDLLNYFRDQVSAQSAVGRDGGIMSDFETLENADAGAAPPAAPSPVAGEQSLTSAGPGGGRDDSHSQTTIQEEGVDEADVIKTDGTYVYILAGERLRIVNVSAPESLALSSELTLDGYAREMYLFDNKVIALTDIYEDSGREGVVTVEPAPLPVDDSSVTMDPAPAAEPDASTEPARGDEETPTTSDPVVDDTLIAPALDFYYPISRPRTLVSVIDVSDPTSPTVLSQTKFDGSIAASRMIDGMLHLVVANYQYYYFDIMPFFGRPQFDAAEIDPKSLIPRYDRLAADGQKTEGDLLNFTDLYRPVDADGFGIVSIISLDVSNDADFKAVGVVAEPGMIYSSTEALYLTDTNYDYLGNQRENTDIYKFAYEGNGATPVANGNVPGRILNQYSMSEYNGFLRVATTVDAVFGFTGQTSPSHNDVYVLADQGGKLTTVGSITDIAPGETIQSARFIGDRGFVVTFEQVDPLFTLDLSDATNPRIVGELKVPGFSTFIVPMDENHLLTVGQYIPDEPSDEFSFQPWGVQLSIFDVTDFANPVQTHNLVIGDDTGAYSEALYNPKAFTYFAERGLVALPISIYDYQPPIFTIDPVDGVVSDAGMGGGSTGSDGSVATTTTVAPEPADNRGLGDVEGAPPSEGGGSTPDETGMTDAGETGDSVIEDDPGDAGADDADASEDMEFPEEPITPPDIYPLPPALIGGFDGIYVYSVSTDGGFTELKRISTRFDELGYYGSSFTRGVFINENIFGVTDYGLRGERIDAAESASFELFMGPPYEIINEPGFVDGGIAIDAIDAPPPADVR